MAEEVNMLWRRSPGSQEYRLENPRAEVKNILDHAQLKKDLEELGYCVLEGVLPCSECQALGECLERIYQQLGGDERQYPGFEAGQERLIFNLHNKDPLFLSLLDHPGVFPLLQEYLGEDLVLNYFNARDTRKGYPLQRLHLDSRVPSPAVPLMAQVIWMVDDFTEENGATRVVPGSHRSGKPPEPDQRYAEERTVIGERGSVLIYNSSLWHGAGSRIGDGRRWGIIATYSRWFIKPSMDFARNTPSEVLSTLSPRQKQLLHFNSIPPHSEFERTSTVTKPQEDSR